MTFEQFDTLVEETFDKIRKLRDTKGKEYANNEQDRLANFKSIGQELGISPLAVLLTYSKKHGRAIDNYCKSGGISHSEESIEGRILDRITYDLLLLGLVKESNDARHDGTRHEFKVGNRNPFLCDYCGEIRTHKTHTIKEYNQNEEILICNCNSGKHLFVLGPRNTVICNYCGHIEDFKNENNNS